MTSVETGHERTRALDEFQTAWCWGRERSYFTDTTTVGGLRPTIVPGGGKYTDVAIGVDHLCALTAASATECWGANWAGQLGDDGTTGRNHPSGLIEDPVI